MATKRALLSVTDKTGIVQFAEGLVALGFEVLSTGGTARALRAANVPVTDVSEVTDFPEMLDGRVKTLHPMIHGSLLGRLSDPEHVRQMEEVGMEPISVLAVNLYAFEDTISKPHTFEEAVESIDIGGPAMLRAASKNHEFVAVVVDPGDYASVLEALDTEDMVRLRKELAAKSFQHTAYYDSLISRYLYKELGEQDIDSDFISIGLKKVMDFRYGENPHQRGALYQDSFSGSGIPQAIQLWGKELSYNNVNDSDGAWELVADLPFGSCAIIKHGNPCGAAKGATLGASYLEARESDPISAFGGIAAFNSEIDAEAANAMTSKGNFLEVVIAPSFTSEAVDIFKSRSGWGQDVRLLAAPLPVNKKVLTIKSIRGGAILQESDEDPSTPWRVVTTLAPTEEQMAALKFQWSIVQHVKSNAIVVGTASRLLGVGAGQMNRVQSVRLALDQAGELTKGAALASDAFFPFPDSIETAAAAGIAVIVQPGGSKKDDEVIAKANELGIAMCFTGIRHFRH